VADPTRSGSHHHNDLYGSIPLPLLVDQSKQISEQLQPLVDHLSEMIDKLERLTGGDPDTEGDTDDKPGP
jgi:hypothetical protein